MNVLSIVRRKIENNLIFNFLDFRAFFGPNFVIALGPEKTKTSGSERKNGRGLPPEEKMDEIVPQR